MAIRVTGKLRQERWVDAITGKNQTRVRVRAYEMPVRLYGTLNGPRGYATGPGEPDGDIDEDRPFKLAAHAPGASYLQLYWENQSDRECVCTGQHLARHGDPCSLPLPPAGTREDGECSVLGEPARQGM